MKNELEVRQSSFWENCDRRFFLQELRQNFPQAADPEAMRKCGTHHTGTLFHKWAEVYYRDGDLDETKALAEVTYVLEESSNATAAEAMQDKKWNTAFKQAMVMGKNYPAWVKKEGCDTFDVLAIEERMSVPVETPFGTLVLTGQPDLVGHDKTLDGYIVLDYKTKAGDLDKQHPRENDEQVLTYCWMVWKIYGEIPKMAYHQMVQRSLQNSKSATFYVRSPITITEEMMERHDERISLLAAERMRAYSEFQELGDDLEITMRPSFTGECNWKCPFYDVCPALDIGEDWQYELEVGYTEEEQDA